MGFEVQAKEEKASQQQAKPTFATAPVSSADFGDPIAAYEAAFGTASPQRVDEEDESFEQVSIPAPRVKHKRKAVPVAADHVPTTDEVLNPERPDLSSASRDVVGASIERLVTNIYKSLEGSLDELKVTLAKTAPPPETPFALKLIGWAVEQIASFAISQIGKMVADELFKDAPAAAASPEVAAPVRVPKGASRQVRRKAERDAAKAKAAAAKSKKVGATDADASAATAEPSAAHQAATKGIDLAGPKAGKALGDKAVAPPTSAPAETDIQHRAAPGSSILVEFLTRQKGALRAREVNALTTLHLVSATAERSGMTDLNEKLGALLNSAALTGWFSQKVTMEWLNFLARASLGPRAEGQTTDMIGANTFEGIAEGGPGARQQWLTGDGFVEVRLKTPDLVNGLAGVVFQGGRIPSSFGAAGVLKHAGDQVDAHGAAYNLATLPVYRRIHIQTGPSKLTDAQRL